MERGRTEREAETEEAEKERQRKREREKRREKRREGKKEKKKKKREKNRKKEKEKKKKRENRDKIEHSEEEGEKKEEKNRFCLFSIHIFFFLLVVFPPPKKKKKGLVPSIPFFIFLFFRIPSVRCLCSFSFLSLFIHLSSRASLFSLFLFSFPLSLYFPIPPSLCLFPSRPPITFSPFLFFSISDPNHQIHRTEKLDGDEDEDGD